MRSIQVDYSRELDNFLRTHHDLFLLVRWVKGVVIVCLIILFRVCSFDFYQHVFIARHTLLNKLLMDKKGRKERCRVLVLI